MIETMTNPNAANGHNIQPVLPTVPCNIVYHEDCISGLKRFPDNFFDLAVVDPPYGIGMDKNPCGRLSRYGSVSQADNNIPTEEYFAELIRTSKNQIIWGGNYFNLPPTRCFIIWDKQQPEGVSFAMCEYAWTSFKTSAKIFYKRPQGADEYRIHPTQKPVALYDWIYNNYASEGNLILDTHLGSGSSRIAAHKAGLSFVGFEIDSDYYEAQEKRFKTFTSQLRLF
jgi:site-specific DNA-methyltransferase (adenine-specific)